MNRPGRKGHLSPAQRNAIRKILKVSIGGAIILWLVVTGQIDFSLIDRVTGRTIVLSLLLSFTALALASYRLRMLLALQDIPLDIRTVFRINCIGFFYSLVLPGGISGDAVKIFYLLDYKNDEHGRTPVVVALLVDRFFGILAILLLGIITAASLMKLAGAAAQNQIRPLFSLILFLLLASILVLVFLFSGRAKKIPVISLLLHKLPLQDKVEKILQSLQTFRDKYAALSVSFLWGVTGHIATILVIWLIAVDLGLSPGFFEVISASTLGLIANFIPVSPGGLGVGEKAFQELFLLFSVSGGATVFLIARFFLFSPAIYGFIAYLNYRGKTPLQKDEDAVR